MSTIKLYHFAKKAMSTDEPSDQPLNQQIVETITGTFRAPYDILSPVVRIENNATMAFTTDPPNYCKIDGGAEQVTRYYWIDKFIWITDTILDLYLTEDYLATWRSAIQASSQYVVRAASTWNGELQDALYPNESSQSIITETLTQTQIPWYNPNGWNFEDGWFVIGINNSDDDAIGSVSYYALNNIAFQSLRNALFSSTSYTNMSFSEIEEPLYKSLFNPMQYIVSCKWFPIRPDITGATNVTFLNIGWFPAPAFAKQGSYAYRLAEFTRSGHFSLTLQKHPSAATRGAYLNTAPWYRRTLYIPPFGSIELDTAKMALATMYPTVYWWIDFISGEVRIRVTSPLNDDAILADSVAMLGMDVGLAQQTQNLLGAAGGALSAGISAGSGLAGLLMGSGSMFVSGLAGAASGIANAVASFAPDVQALAGHPSIISGDIAPVDQVTLTFPANDDLADRGRPLCEVRTLNTLQGYVLCANAHMAVSNMLGDERRAIESALNSGIYLE